MDLSNKLSIYPQKERERDGIEIVSENGNDKLLTIKNKKK